MTATASTLARPAARSAPEPLTRRALSASFAGHCSTIGAAEYLLVDTAPEGHHGEPRIIVSNWMFDTVQHVGLDAIRRLAESAVASFPGALPRGWHPRALAALLECPALAVLADDGCREIFCLKLPAGKRRYHAIFSSPTAGAIDMEALARLQIAACHDLSLFERQAAAADDPLSERERECLFWVSEGKTAEDISTILAVSANTVNSYVAHAIHKLAASNRAMAIATAIRRGLI